MVRFDYLLSAFAVFAMGCGGKPEVPMTPVPDGGIEAIADAAPPATTITAVAPDAGPTAEAVPPPVATGPCDSMMSLAMTTAIQSRAKQEGAAGLKPSSSFVCQNVAEGAVATIPINMQPGGCYTVLAHSFPNVTELDVALKPNFGQPPPPLLAGFANVAFAQDSDTGPTATIGKKPDCYKSLLPIPAAAIVEVRARTGAGPVGAQVYSK